MTPEEEHCEDQPDRQCETDGDSWCFTHGCYIKHHHEEDR